MHLIDLTWIGIGALIFDILILVAGYRYAKIKAERKEQKRREKGWVNIEVGNEVHTVPVNDSFTHVPEDECGCSPKNIPVPRQDGTFGWQVVHNAADGRV